MEEKRLSELEPTQFESSSFEHEPKIGLRPTASSSFFYEYFSFHFYFNKKKLVFVLFEDTTDQRVRDRNNNNQILEDEIRCGNFDGTGF